MEPRILVSSPGAAGNVMTSTERYETLFHRHETNPSLTAADWPYPHTRCSTPEPPDFGTARHCSPAESGTDGATHICAPLARVTESIARPSMPRPRSART
jgi:hypothetical protein